MRFVRWLFLALSAACIVATPSPAPPPPGASPSVVAPPEPGLRVVERWVGGASPGDEVPVIVAVHGLGDSPENFAWAFDGFPAPARVVLPAGPTPFGRGYAWMTIRTAEGRDEALARQIAASADRVAALCRSLSAQGRAPVLTGFSQGGMVSWAVAVGHPDAIAAAVPVAGYLAPPLAPATGQTVAPIIALHGESDEVVPVALDRQGAARVEQAGGRVVLQTYPGRGHVLAPEMRRDLYRAIAEHLPAAN